ncbi:MAG: hypothetical protein PHX04_03515 [Bacilli bacterium]|nr:hypothetical protein [Bacilli bacterium]
MENANINEAVTVEDKKGMSKPLKAILILLVIALTILVGIAIGYWLFKLVNP